MWEPDSVASTSNHQRGLILLVSALGFCFIVYKAWGPLLLITCALVFVVHACYSLQVNDSLLTPRTLVLLRYIRELLVELALAVKLLAGLGYQRSKGWLDYLRQKYEERNRRQLREQQQQAAEGEMAGRHRNVYRLSTPSTELDEQITPINKNRYHAYALNGACNVARTSTPLPERTNWKKNVQQNGDLGLFMPINNSPVKKSSSQRSENRQPSITLPRNDDTFYSPKGSPWGNSISPKIKDKSPNMKTVQTVAGPLLASTRYNIDPKVYSDVSSPGLTSRLTKYASEANNKLTHQSQYGTGQFPKVNLYANPIPLLSPKVARARMPVTVRVAPPELVNYAPSDSLLHPEKSKSFFGSSPEPRETKSCPSVAQVLKEISLKRHASNEDSFLELSKKQRTERVSEGQLINLEEMMQKRARDESITSEEELSPQAKTQRPLKRPKASSCHDVLNSLSSSLNVFSGVKRKAMDTSRCSTPDIEKHFKPSSKSPTRSSSLTMQTSGEHIKSKDQLNVKVSIEAASGEPYQYKEQKKAREPTKTEKPLLAKNQKEPPKTINPTISEVHKEITNSAPKTANLTDKLFMRAEPQSNEKLKSLIEEQEKVEAKFTMEGKDEIKKQDIVNMRQNSMRLRLQSMFDAISGKSASKIDPDVVIQAEEINPPNSSVFTSLSSLTTTTTINTSPITTTLVPILKTDNDNKSPIKKHVTFNLSSTGSTFSSTVPTLSNQDTIKPVDSKPAASTTSSFSGLTATTTSTPSFSFGSNILATSSNSMFTSPKSTEKTTTTSSGFSFSSTATTSSQNAEVKTTTISGVASSMFAPKSSSETLNTSTVISSSGFTFGAKTTPISTPATTSASAISFPSMTTPAIAKSKESSVANSGFSFGNTLAKSPTNTSIAQTTTTTIFGGDKKESGGFSFNTPAATSTSTSTISSQSASIFGATAANASKFSAGSTATSSTMAVTTSTATRPAFSFGATAATTAATSKPSGGFTFGSSTTTNAPTFGVSTPSSVSTSTFVAPAASSATDSTFAASYNLGFTTPNQSILGTSTSGFSSSGAGPASSFKFSASTATTTTASIFGSQSNTPTFGAPVPNTTTTPSLFGNTSTPATTTSTIPSLFGNTAANPAATTTATPTISAFGSSAPQQPQSGSIFSGVNATTPAAAPSIFGSSVSTAAPNGLFSGGASSSPAASIMGSTAIPAESTNIFGQTKSPASLTFGGTSSTFGTNNQSATFNAPSSTSAFQLGSNTSSSGGLPSFSNIKPSPQFGASTTQASTSGSIFGSSSTTGFGTTPTGTTSAFGAAPVANTGFGTTPAASTGFGIQNNPAVSQQPTAFGTSPSGFGTTPTASSPFRAQTTTSAPTLFGNTAAGATTSAGSFSFGGTQQQPQPQAQQPSTSFAFGGSSGTNTPNSGGIFQFGGATAPKPAGFNFNAPSAAPTMNFTGSAPGAAPTFNAPPTNMFSMGSGSSTPRSRNSRQRRQR